MNISFILMVQLQYGSYEMAGRVAAFGIVVWALQTVPTSRMADALGQRLAMTPLIVLHISGVVLGIVTAMNHGHELLLWCAVALASMSGPLGSLTRARWSHILERDDDIHTAFALEGVLDETLFITGPALATVLATAVWPPLGLIVSTVGMVIGLTILLSQSATEPAPRGRSRTEGLGWRIPAPVWAAMLIAFGVGCVFGSFDISVVAFSEEQGRHAWAGVLIALVSAGSFLGGLLYGSRRWRAALWVRTVGAAAGLAAGFTALAFTPTMVWFAIVGFFAGTMIAPTMTNIDTIVQRVVRRHQITEGMGWLRIGMGIGTALGAWLAGMLIDLSGSRWGLVTAAAAAVIMFGIALLAAPVIRRGTDRGPLVGAGVPVVPPPTAQVESPPLPPVP